MAGKRLGGSFFIGAGLAGGEYYEDDSTGYEYSDSGTESILNTGVQVSYDLLGFSLVLDLRLVNTPTYESSLLIQIGLQR